MDYIDKVYYINLDHRKDRLLEIEKVLDDLEIPIQKRERISAIYDEQFGIVGCCKSHIQVLEKFIESGYENCMVLEDDFQYSKKDTFFINISNVFKHGIDFDIIQLAYNDTHQIPQNTNYPFLRKFTKAGTTSAFIIHKNFAPQLLQNFKESLKLLSDYISIHNTKYHDYCLDVYWNNLPKTKWFMIYPKLGHQRTSYSDIEKRITNYGV
jgi:GR25 family glycosyltransferase involved in LPS biosynthesis